MAKVSADKLLELLGRSQLVEKEQLDKQIAKLKEKCGGELPSDPEKLASALVEQDTITRWQSQNLLEGKHKGFLLGKYKLLKHLGSGGMSSVYLGEHRQMGHRVAIKVLPPRRVADSSYLARFKKEAQAVAALNHVNIVRAFDIDQDGNTHYFVMEFVEGRDLQNIVKEDGVMDYAQAADYIAQAADGLEHAHNANLVHRDIKPANLLVNHEDVVKILDLGLAKTIDDENPSLTVAFDENVLGTADYLAPEQAVNSHQVDHRADIYSLGCTLYFVLTGHPPFPEGTLQQRLLKHQKQAPPSIYEDRPDAPEGIVNICLRMMAKAREARHQSAAEVASELRGWMARTQSPVAAGKAAARVGDSSPDIPAKKELRTRKSGGMPVTRRRDSDTVPAFDSDTFTSPPRKGTRTRNSDSSGEFVFDVPKGPRGGSSKKPIARKKSAFSTTTAQTPLWIWLALGGSSLLALVLLFFVLKG